MELTPVCYYPPSVVDPRDSFRGLSLKVALPAFELEGCLIVCRSTECPALSEWLFKYSFMTTPLPSLCDWFFKAGFKSVRARLVAFEEEIKMRPLLFNYKSVGLEELSKLLLKSVAVLCWRRESNWLEAFC